MEATQKPSTFAQIIDKLRNKSEQELKMLHAQLLSNDITAEANNLVAENSESYNRYKNIKKGNVTRHKTSLNTVFGIWEDKNVSLNSIREKAWQRTK